MPAVILLGPTRRPDAAPLAIRREVAALLRKAGAEVILLEDEPGTCASAKAPRLPRARDADLVVLLWPFGARVHGSDAEVDDLLRELARGELSPRQVVLLVESRAVGLHPDGTPNLDEPGDRTRSHVDLVRLGCPLRRWRTLDALRLHALALARERRPAPAE